MVAKECIAGGRAVLGIEFGSTRIKAVLVDENNQPIASGAHDWENRLENGMYPKLTILTIFQFKIVQR